jgi:hypothetical protein
MALNAIFNNISVISWWPILLVEETGVSGEIPRVNDVIVQINNIDVTNFDKRSALQVLRNSSSSVASFVSV